VREDGAASKSPVERLYLGARGAALDPRTLGALQALPRAAVFLRRANVRTTANAGDDTVVPVRTTFGLAAQVFLDELMIAMFRHPRLIPDDDAIAFAVADLAAAQGLFAERGWLDDPAAYHRTPPEPSGVTSRVRPVAGFRYEHVRFTSGWEPHPGEPGRERWLAHERNRRAHAWISRAPSSHDTGTWLVCVHGFGMGQNPLMDLRSFKAGQLHAKGINVAVVVLPLHGPRASGSTPGEGFMSIDLVDSMHGLAQAAWDVRSVVGLLRSRHSARRIGLFGHSLGGHVVSLVAGLEDGLDCVIAGIPVVDLPDLFRRHSPPQVAGRALSFGALGPMADSVHRVVSPFALGCRVPFEHRYVFGGLGDRMATFGHARRLWLHWDRPALATYHGGHIGFYWSATVRRFVDEALRNSGLVPEAA